MLLMFLNAGLCLLAGVTYWYLSTKRGWFAKDHVQFPKWLSFCIGLCGLFIPATPFFIDGILLGMLLYFGSEYVYQLTGRSPLATAVNWCINCSLTGWKWLRERG